MSVSASICFRVNALRIPNGLVPLLESIVQVIEAAMGVVILGAAIEGAWTVRKAAIGRRKICFFMMMLMDRAMNGWLTAGAALKLTKSVPF